MFPVVSILNSILVYKRFPVSIIYHPMLAQILAFYQGS